MNIIEQASKIHFIGIGGIGISAIARLVRANGKKVSGSDLNKTDLTDELSKLGIQISIGHKASNINGDIDLVIRTVAADDGNPEIVAAKKLRIPTITYPEALGIISQGRFTIAVSGTHGKTTTTAMLAKICIDAGRDPTVIVGSILKDAKSNLIVGKSNLFIVEACEYRESFLNLKPDILVITNIDNDHLDYYKNLGNIQKAFKKMIAKTSVRGGIVTDVKAPQIKPILKNTVQKVYDYSSLKIRLSLKIPGDHNIKNAKAAVSAAMLIGISKKKSIKSLADFEGTWRRSEFRGETSSGTLIFDDYGHHPTEIKATLKGFRDKFKRKKITAVFQPHLYSRTKLLFKDFVKSFASADALLLAPIYPAREKYDPTITSEMLAEKISGAKSFRSLKEIIGHIKKMKLGKNDILITMGAGDIYKIGESLIND